MNIIVEFVALTTLKVKISTSRHKLITKLTTNFSQMLHTNFFFVNEERIIFQERHYLIQVPLISSLWVLLKNCDSVADYLFLRVHLLNMLLSNIYLLCIHWLFLFFHNVTHHVAKTFNVETVLFFFLLWFNRAGSVFWESWTAMFGQIVSWGYTSKNFIWLCNRGFVWKRGAR